MSVKPPAKSSLKPVPPPAVFGSDAAPVIYFDGVVAMGIRDGVVQLELGVNEIVPVSLQGDQIKTRIVIAAHLRCTAQTATNMMEVIERITTSAPPIEAKK